MSSKTRVPMLPIAPATAELFDREHRWRMYSGIWEYGVLLGMITSVEIVEQDSENVIWGRVSGRRDDLERTITERVGEVIPSCRRHLDCLERFGYIRRSGGTWDHTLEVRISPLPIEGEIWKPQAYRTDDEEPGNST